jgi:hypothetical protein
MALLENAALAALFGPFGLNDILCHSDGYLVVAKSDEGVLIKVPLAAPGMTLTGDGRLQLTDNTPY